MFWIIIGIVGGVALISTALVMVIIHSASKDYDEDYKSGYENPFE